MERLERNGRDEIGASTAVECYRYQRLPMTRLIPHLLNKSSRRPMQPKEARDGP